jgi:hypothetical protein
MLYVHFLSCFSFKVFILPTNPPQFCYPLESATCGGHTPPSLYSRIYFSVFTHSKIHAKFTKASCLSRCAASSLECTYIFSHSVVQKVTSRHLSTQYTICLQKVQLVNWWYSVKVVHYWVCWCLGEKQTYTKRKLQRPVQTSLHKWLTVHLVSSTRVLPKCAIHSEQKQPKS